MMNRAQKDEVIASLKKDIGDARAVFLTNLIGIGSNDSVEIRKNVREAKGKLVVTRNTLFRIAAEGTYMEDLCKDLKGPSALAFAFEDAPVVAKALKNAAKDHEVIEFRGGFLGEEALSVAKINELADLPSREEMLGTLLATMNAPISALARVLNSIKEKKEEGGGDVVEAKAEEAPATEEKKETEE